MLKRVRIPPSVEERVLFEADHTCCICRTKGKDVQIHHIDSNPRNNAAENLAVVCLDCHSLVSGARGLGKRYKPGEVRRYKRAWEKFVQGMRGIRNPRIGYKNELVSQIDLVVCEILASKNDMRRVQNLLQVLYELHLWRGGPEINKKIIEGFSHLATMSGLESGALAGKVAEKLWEICWHFGGPHLVPMGREEAREVLGCIDALDSLSFFTCAHGHSAMNIRTITSAAENFFQIGLSYSNKRIVNALIEVYERSLDACHSDKKQLEFSIGWKAIRSSMLRMRKFLLREKPRWSNEITRLKKALADGEGAKVVSERIGPRLAGGLSGY